MNEEKEYFRTQRLKRSPSWSISGRTEANKRPVYHRKDVNDKSNKIIDLSDDDSNTEDPFDLLEYNCSMNSMIDVINKLQKNIKYQNTRITAMENTITNDTITDISPYCCNII